MRTYPAFEDLGLHPEADRTEDLRPGKYDWDDVEHGFPSRYFDAAHRAVDHTTDMTVRLDGIQWADGNVERTITVSPGNLGSFDCLLPAVARALGLALIAAADEIEGI